MRKSRSRTDEEHVELVPAAVSIHTSDRGYGSLSTTPQTPSVAPNTNNSTVLTIDPTATNPPTLHAQLTYSWSNIDVYGEVSQPQPFWSHQLRRCLHSCLSPCCCPSRKTSTNSLNGSSHNGRLPTPRKHLLKNVCGIAAPGQLLAIMGSSGAGKTTLLNALAFRSPPGLQIASTARRALNGRTVRADELRMRCAYVQQEDLFIGSLTAREHLAFQAMLRIAGDGRRAQAARMERVAEVLRELSLIDCQDTVIGTLGRTKGLSGGERKRLAFASEALTDPALLLCDEPTSGLDSFMARSVVQVLRGLAQRGKTVVLTIHQPSSELYALFDKLQLMADGRVAFLGTPGEAETFFGQLLEAPCPSNYNPADFYVQLLAMVPGQEAESAQTIRRVCDAYATSAVGKAMQRAVVRNEGGGATSGRDGGRRSQKQQFSFDDVRIDGGRQEASVLGGCRASWWTQFRVILWRSWLSVLKEPMLVRVRLIQTVMIAVLIGVIFFGQQLDQDGVMNMNGAMFLFLTNMTFQNVFSVINVFCAELPVFLRESRSNLYRTDTYFLGKTVAELPLFLVIPLIFTSITYPMIGLRADWTAFAITCALVTLVANVSTSFGYFISCSSSSISMALSIGPPIIIPFLLFGGYFLNAGSVPVYFEWLSYVSWFRYGNEGLMINQWASLGEGEIACTRPNATCPASGRVILETLNFDENNLGYDFLGLAMLIVGFRVAAYVALVIRASSKE